MESLSNLFKRRLLLPLVIAAFASLAASAATVSVTVDGIKYTIDTTTGEATVASQSNSLTKKDLVIPDFITYNGANYPVTTIKNWAFDGCSGLTGSLTIGNSVTTIGSSAFRDCSGLTGELTIPNSVITIGEFAFKSCSGLTGSLTIGNSVTTIGRSAFEYCSGLTGSLTIPNSVTTIGSSAFYGCSGLTGSLTIPNSVTTIDIRAFFGCSGLTGSLTIPNSVTTIGEGAFYGCSGLTGSLTISNSITTIGDRTFYECSGLTGALTIPNSVTTLGEGAFEDCSGLTGSLTIGNSVTTIGSWAFYGCSGLTGSLTIPNSVTTIGDDAFANCRGLTGSLTIPNSVTTIGEFAFKNCSGLTGSLTIGNSVTTIGRWAFHGCNSLTDIYLPASLESIGYWAFYFDAKSVTCDAVTPPTIKKISGNFDTAFYTSTKNSAPLIVPTESIEAYKTAYEWKDFKYIRGDQAEPSAISLDKTTASINVGESLSLTATVTPADATDKSVTWSSANPAIATVDNGMVKGIAPGTVTITATTANGLKAECKVTVSQPATGIEIDFSESGIAGDDLTMYVGDTKSVKIKFTPDNVSDKTLTWSSSDLLKVTVDENGLVTARAIGSSTITVTAASGVKTTLKVIVVATPAASITLNKTEATLKATESVDLVATILPTTTTDKSVTWKSSDEAIATVDTNGKVTAVAVGKAIITATAASGVSASCAITVAETPASGIVIDKEALGISGDNLEMRVGDTKTINVTVEPATATDKSVTFTSSNPAIASVDANGKVIAISLGTATITITAKSGVTAQLTVKVIETPVASLTINSSAVTMKVSEYIDLEATAMPVTATDKSVTWSSSNAAVAKVDAAGRVTAMSEGSAVITATAKSGVTATCAVTVLPLELNLEVSVSATKVREGNPVEYSVEASGDTQGWTYAWSRGNEVVSTDMTFNLPMTMTAGNEQATETANVKLTASYVGDNGEQWGLVEEDAPAVTVYRRPLTPSQLLRKGDGSSKTLIIMMGMTDSELAQRGYSYVYGYTDATGTDHIVATTGKRYCHMEARVFDDASMRKWCYALWQYADGSVVTSGKRYLDGSSDEDFDASTFGSESISVTPDFSNSDNWIRAVEGSVMITVDNESDTRITVHTISGAMVRNTMIPAATFGSVALDSSSLAPGIYVVSVTSGSQRSSKKVIIQ